MKNKFGVFCLGCLSVVALCILLALVPAAPSAAPVVPVNSGQTFPANGPLTPVAGFGPGIGSDNGILTLFDANGVKYPLPFTQQNILVGAVMTFTETCPKGGKGSITAGFTTGTAIPCSLTITGIFPPKK